MKRQSTRGILSLEAGIDEVADVCSSGRCVLVTGQSFGEALGYPSRWSFVEGALGIAVKPPEQSGDATESALQSLTSAEQRATVLQVAQRLFVRKKRRRQAEKDALLRDLGAIPFAAAVTTAWDDSLSLAFESRDPAVISSSRGIQLRDIPAHRFIIAKLFGNLDAATFRITWKEVCEALREDVAFSAYVRSRLDGNSLLFIGMTAEEVHGLVSAFPGLLSTVGLSYAIVAGQLGPFMHGLALNAPITVMPASHVFEAVRALRERFGAAALDWSSTLRRPLRAPRLSEIRLRNIAGFISLDIPAISTKTVLIGNNGSGKSSLLRAIALGLCGNHPNVLPAASYLLRSGASQGSIVLRIGSAFYRTELARDGDTVRVTSTSPTALQRGNLVVLGFPPLRGAIRGLPARRTSLSRSLQESKDPSVGDLQPLLFGTVDERLNDLKSWIIFLQKFEAERFRADAQLRRFFAVLQDFMSDTRIRLAGVDERKRDVYVETQDGVVPLEQVSQGMSSLFAWIGTTIQRLYEANPRRRKPEDAPALILVDEIDAHLHPEWQQILMTTLERHFPRLQIIATTHSPLIAANLRPIEILLASRTDSGEPTFTHPDVELTNLRADQILTSPIFGLSTTRGVQARSDIDRYSILLGKASLTPGERSELTRLRNELSSTLRSGETPLARMVETALTATIADITEQQDTWSLSEQAIAELERQLATLNTQAEAVKRQIDAERGEIGADA